MQPIVDLILALDWLWGAFAGGAIAYFVERKHFRRASAEQQRVASMQVASQLRYWLTETIHVISAHEVFEAGNTSSDPNDVNMPSISAFPFENSLESIALLPADIAEDVFGLVERKMSVEKEASFTSFVQDNEGAAEIFNAKVAHIWLDAASTYRKLASIAGWTAPAATKDEMAMMRERAAKLDEIRNRPGVDLDDVIPANPPT